MFALPAAALAESETVAAEQGSDIVVTAERRSTTLTQTPVAVQVFTADRLAETGVSHLYDIAQVTPGIRMDLLGTNLQPTIRGITTAVSGVGNSMNTAMYVDGFYQPSNLSNGLELSDISQIEVVKGPQGTLFGRNATAGAIIVTTADPSYTFGGKAEVGYGSFDDKRASLFLTGGLTDSLAVSGSALWRDSDGFTKNILTGKHDGFTETVMLRGKIMYEPSDRMKFTLGGRYSDSNDPAGRVYRIVGPASTAYSIPGTVTAEKRYTNAQGLRPMSKTKVWSVTLTSDFDFDFASLRSYTGYQDEKTEQQTDLDGSSAKITDIVTDTTSKVFSQEFILSSSGGGPLNWNVGLNYFYQNDDAPYYSIATQANPTPPNQRASKIVTDAYAAFVDATWEFVPDWFLTGGLRYSYEKKHFLYGLTEPRSVDVNESWDSFTPRVVLRHRLTSSSSVYASYSKGFKSGTFNASSSSTIPVNPEEIEAYEVGYKMTSSGIVWNSSAYYYKYKNLQVSAYNFLLNPPATMLQNVGSAEIYGFDSELIIPVTDNFRINMNVAYTHGRYQDFPGAIAYIPNATNTAYQTITVDGSGNKMMRAPEWTGTIGFHYQVPTEFGTFAISPSLYITDRIWSDAANQYSIDPYALLDITASWTSPDEKWKVSVIGKNITDKYYISYWDPVGAALMVADGAPASVRVSVGYKF